MRSDRPRFAITVAGTFFAEHQLRLYDGSLEPRHGHDWNYRVTIAADALDSIGVVMDFHALQGQIEQIVAPFRGKLLNDVPPFDATNPSAENVVVHIAKSLKLADSLHVEQVEIEESAGCFACYRPGGGD